MCTFKELQINEDFCQVTVKSVLKTQSNNKKTTTQSLFICKSDIRIS